MRNYEKGSEWRRWDLHLHTPFTKKEDRYTGSTCEEKWDNFYTSINEYVGDGTNPYKSICAIGITDYLSIDNYLRVVSDNCLPNCVALILPNVELRMTPIAAESPINIHCLFSPDMINKLEDSFFAKLEFEYRGNTYGATRSELIRLGRAYSNNSSMPEADLYRKGLEQYVISHQTLSNVFRKNPELRNNTIVIVSNKSTDGASGTKDHSYYFEGDVSTLDATRQSIYQLSDMIFSSSAKDIAYFLGEGVDDIDAVRYKCGSLKPCVHGCDAHSNKGIFLPYDNRFCWIKANPTFEGLRQCLYHPQERVFIGTIPPALDREIKSRRSNIARISTHRIANPKNTLVHWLDFDIPLNAGLTTVIGNKGSGKSALSDIIGHLCKSTTMDSTSFLNGTRFRKSPKNYANDYNAVITWADSHTEEQLLSDSKYDTTIENAQYLPQKYIEDVCNDIDNKFQSEIDRVIFSYVDSTERGSAKNLKELVSNKSKFIEDDIARIHKELEGINNKIISLEQKKTSKYRVHVEDSLKKLKETFERHMNTKPVEVKKPTPKNDDKNYNDNLSTLNREIDNIQVRIEETRSKLTFYNARIDETKQILARIKMVEGTIAEVNKEIEQFIESHNIMDKNIGLIKSESPKKQIEIYLDELNNFKEHCQNLLDNEDVGNIGLLNQLIVASEKKKALILTADGEERVYQKYLADIKEWEDGISKIKGDENTEDTIVYFQSQLSFLNDSLEEEYTEFRKQREDIVRAIFQAKTNLVGIYQNIYAPIEKEMLKLLGNLEEGISFDAEVQLVDNNFAEDSLSYVNKKYNGIFKGETESRNQMNKFIKATEFQQVESVLELIQNTMKVIEEDIDLSNNKVSNKANFYQYLCGLDYLNVAFKLKVGERNLEELSPGERGIVLLIFYLALSKDNIPIIIDQPEDNLDNQSVFNKLVPCICEAKKKRQVIIVTHNPNIAIACDAEQIIYCEIDKSNNSIHYEAGAIEDLPIKKHVIDVLEGTKPAFDLRGRKYFSYK